MLVFLVSSYKVQHFHFFWDVYCLALFSVNKHLWQIERFDLFTKMKRNHEQFLETQTDQHYTINFSIYIKLYLINIQI